MVITYEELLAEKRQTIYQQTNKMSDEDLRQVEMHPRITEPTKRIEVNPLDAQPLSQRAGGYSNFNQTDQAIKDDTSAIKINPQFKEAHLERAFAYQSIDEPEKAAADQQRADELGELPTRHLIAELSGNSFRGSLKLTTNQSFLYN